MSLQNCVERGGQTASCLPGRHHAGIGSPHHTLHFHIIIVVTFSLLTLFIPCLSVITDNRPPGMVPNKMVYMTHDLHRLAKYFEVPLSPPSDPVEAMFQKGTYKQDLMKSIQSCVLM